MKMGDLYNFDSSLLYGCFGISGDPKESVIAIFLRQKWDKDCTIYEFYFPTYNKSFWFRETELNYAKRLSQEEQ